MQHACSQNISSHQIKDSFLKLYTDMLWAHLARIETRNQGHSDIETVGDSQGPKMYLYTKYGTVAINNIGDLLMVHFFKN